MHICVRYHWGFTERECAIPEIIDGGVYQESRTLVDNDIPDNKRGLRNRFAQQQLHEKMIQMQYKYYNILGEKNV